MESQFLRKEEHRGSEAKQLIGYHEADFDDGILSEEVDTISSMFDVMWNVLTSAGNDVY